MKKSGMIPGILAVLVLMSGGAWGEPLRDGVADNVLANWHFEDGEDWGGTKDPPEGWTQYNTSIEAYIDPTTAPIMGDRSLITYAYPHRGPTTGQEGFNIPNEWRMIWDIACEDPEAGLRDQNAMVIYIFNDAGVVINIQIHDRSPDNGVGELWVRTPSYTLVGEIPGFSFAPDVTASVDGHAHQLVIDGHFDTETPSYDVKVNLNDGTSVSFPGLTYWNGDAPGLGDVPNKFWLIGDSWSAARCSYDNVALGIAGPWVPPGELKADFNNDGVIDDLDLTILANNWDTCGKTHEEGDANDDGCVDDLDLTALANEWPAGDLDVSAVPEPATLSLLVLGGLAALRRRDRR